MSDVSCVMPDGPRDLSSWRIVGFSLDLAYHVTANAARTSPLSNELAMCAGRQDNLPPYKRLKGFPSHKRRRYTADPRVSCYCPAVLSIHFWDAMATDRCSSKGEEISRPFEARLSSNRVGKDVGPERIKHFRLDKVSLNKSMENVLKVLHSLAQAEEKTHISFWYIDQLVREKGPSYTCCHLRIYLCKAAYNIARFTAVKSFRPSLLTLLVAFETLQRPIISLL